MIVVNKKDGIARKVNLRLKVNDEVVVITGKNKDAKGKIIAIKNNRVWVQGVGLRKKNVPPTQENPKGGVIEIESSIHVSNVQAWDSKLKKGSRIRYEFQDGKKVRILVSSGDRLD